MRKSNLVEVTMQECVANYFAWCKENGKKPDNIDNINKFFDSFTHFWRMKDRMEFAETILENCPK